MNDDEKPTKRKNKGAPPKGQPRSNMIESDQMRSREPMGERRGMAAPTRPEGGGNGMLERFVKNGLRLLYDPKGLPQLLTSLEADGNPLEGLANTLASAVSRLLDSASRKGAEIPDDVLVKGTQQLAENLADFSSQSGGHKYTPEEIQQVLEPFMAAGQPPSAEQGAPMDEQMPPRRGLGGAAVAA